jgi:histidinol-phosphatase (PHP family)
MFALPDAHVHSEFSYDAPEGSMESSCERAVRLGVPMIAFTEHADYMPGAPPLDVERFAESVDRCRTLFPSLRIAAGVELGEPHRFAAEAEALLKSYPFDLVLGSCHSIPVNGALVAIGDEGTLEASVADENVRSFFAETLALVEAAPTFAALTHLDYPKRYWPHNKVSYSERDFQDEYRAVLASAASAGLALEINTDSGDLTHGPCPDAVVVRWWRDAGGPAVSFGSDAHRPDDLIAGFAIAAAIAESAGFRAAGHDFGFWFR